MSHFGISAVRWNAAHTEVEHCMVHRINSDGDEFVADDGEPKPFHEVASRIAASDTVWVLVKDVGADNYDRVDKVRIKTGPHEYLESFSDDTKEATQSLYDLPAF